MKKVFERPEALHHAPFHYCPGCGHSIIHRLIAQVIDEKKLRDKTICSLGVGCAVVAYNYFDVDLIESPHGRAAAVATGVKRARPKHIVFSYQGDGDLAAIGTAETFHAANRGELITIFFVNNAVYGMTGGQMAPTTLCNQKTTTTPSGRKREIEGYPLHIAELLATIEGVSYIIRTSVDSVNNVINTKKAIEKSFRYQL
ncbi:MAG: thiamine pyrophosphate-dependent enzyme, partial [Thermodesulfobacteriota bacterium]|nr:thiamine pyrophosphate-dependent enzyme [Thermodesulfobacteriota bacterium]